MSDTTGDSLDKIHKIHIAFQLGWSIVEMRNRILINASCVLMDKKTLQKINRLPPTAPALPLGPGNPGLNNMANSAYDKIHYAMKAALSNKFIEKLLGLPDDLHLLPDNGCLLSSEASDDIWMTSVWRTLFQRIVALHASRFDKNDTRGSIYEILPPDSNSNYKSYDYYFLYPKTIADGANQKDYADIGIGITSIADLYVTDTNDPNYPKKNFALAELARRALNCLILLFTNPYESVVPEIEKHRWSAVYNILDPAQAQKYTPATPLPDADANIVMQIFSGVLVRLLDSWDGFLREKYYVDTTNPTQADSAFKDETELRAYEAGRSMSSLSWDISATLAPLDKVRPALEKVTGTPREELTGVLTTQVQEAFRNGLTGKDVTYIYQQVTDLSTAMDKLYYDTSGTQKPATNGSLQPINPDLPSESLSTILTSLDYWQRAVKLLTSPSPQNLTSPSSPKATPPSNPAPPPSPKATPPPPRSWSEVLTWDTSPAFRLALIRQSHIWQGLFLHEQSLSSFSGEKFVQGLFAKFMHKVEDAIFSSPSVRKIPWMTIAFVVGIVALIALAIFILHLLGVTMQEVGTGLLFITGGIFGFVGSMVNRIGDMFSQRPGQTQTLSPARSSTTTTTSTTATTSSKTGTSSSSASPTVEKTDTITASSNPALDQLAALVGIAGSVLHQAFEAAYDRIKIEFGHLSYAVSVADPLVQFFFDRELSQMQTVDEATIDATIRDGYDFLTTVIWTGKDLEDEIDRVVSAAFGPIGAYINGSSTRRT